MNIKDYIATGILESYCLGFVTDEERLEVERFAGIYPEIENEIESIGTWLLDVVNKDATPPPPALKNNVMLQIYEMESGEGKKYPPLINDQTTVAGFENWLMDYQLRQPLDNFDNAPMQPLPSTEQVTNFIVCGGQGHSEEEHNDFLEYFVILKGSCDMYMDGVRHSYNAGEIISIPKACIHHAVVTSAEPMLAMVQRVAA